MSRYRKIEVRTWSDEGFRELTPIPACGQGLWFFLLTGPHTGPIPGLFRAGRASMAEELNWELEAFDEAFAEVLGQGMVKADFKARLVWLPEALKYNKPESPNVVRSWRTELDLLPECDLKRDAVATLRLVLESIGPTYVEAFDEVTANRPRKAVSKPSPKPSPKTMPNQEQEQEQEQDTNIMSGQSPDAPSGPDTSIPKREKKVAVPADEKCARWLFGVVLENNAGARKPNISTWTNDVRLMRERDGRSYDEICALFQWAAADSFWCANILSPGKLREKWDQLTMQQARALVPKADSAWWKSDDAKIAKGSEMGMHPLPGESMFGFEGRIRAAIDNGGTPPPQPRMSLVGVAPAQVEPKSILTDEMRAQLKGLTGRAAPAPKETA